MLALVFGLFGLIVGSFLNVLILREGRGSLSGRSACVSCGAQIRWYDLIPVLSWVMLRGRCRDCGQAISPQYPLVELGTAALFLSLGAAPITLLFKLLALPIAALLFAIAIYDLRTTIIPDRWVFVCGALALLAAILGSLQAGASLVPAIFAGPITALPLFLLWYVSKGAWMGLGDPKLALPIGWILGIEGGLIAVLFAFILGAVVSVPLLALSSEWWSRIVARFTPTPLVSFPLFFRKRRRPVARFAGAENEDFIHNNGKKTKTPMVWGFTMQSEVPFGPFLVASCFVIWFAHLYALPLPL